MLRSSARGVFRVQLFRHAHWIHFHDSVQKQFAQHAFHRTTVAISVYVRINRSAHHLHDIYHGFGIVDKRQGKLQRQSFE